MLNFLGLSLMIGFIALTLRVSRQAEPVREVEEAEVEEEENASDDWVQFRVESRRETKESPSLPVGLKRIGQNDALF